MATRKNEGAPVNAPVDEDEGNHGASRRYNNAQKRFAASGKVEPAPRDAASTVDGSEGPELRAAEAAGKRHAHADDQAVEK
jgi:hypothetical protein